MERLKKLYANWIQSECKAVDVAKGLSHKQKTLLMGKRENEAIMVDENSADKAESDEVSVNINH